ncbi:pilus assembly protein TadG-related protein [Mesorhizobium sp. ES1-3]|uniref:pilus assembly protein TadG-related protein n=1 Tax=Mesorhizobium sp. ES1-3 TaxID=2876628 RepID=UPI001CCD19F3|nr:TadE/TadG family type IV pilus assembly protein [Mesorhizobium sp. ES1-3]MBZ9668400.1 pilus assembly protein [Mesorhizobium sp. ES1-3]
MLRTIRAFWHDQRGIALVLVAVTLPAIVGFSLLVIDMSRVNNLQNDLQKAADSFSLAGAAELDGLPGSWARAERAMATLVDNESNFSTSGRFILTSGQPGGTARCNTAGNISWCFLKAIPPTDGIRITAANQASYLADATQAVGEDETRFIQVKVTPEGFGTLFPVSFLPGGTNHSWTIGAVSTAGFTSGVCEYTPVFMCNPYEDTTITGGVTLEQAAQTRQYRRRQIKLRGDGSYLPGNFAFLASPFGNGANELEKMLADSKPQNCYSRDGVDTEPGQNAGPVENGINSRFGINSSNYSDGPAVNVRKGAKNWDQYVKSNKVDYETDPTKGVGLERDSCQIAGNCTMMGGRMGAGDWNFARYWAANHPTRAVPAALSGTGANLPTRYETYRYELDPDGNPATNDSIVGDASVGGEKGNPPAGAGTPISTPDRRLLYGAILDCNALQASGLKFSGRLTGIPVRRFASFFITEPIRDGKDIFVELVDITGKGGNGTLDNYLRDEAQLYR